MCISKTLSNFLNLLIYSGYIGMTYTLYELIGSHSLNGYMNQAAGYGLIVMGSLTQLMITANRFLVVYFFWNYRGTGGDLSKYSNPITIFFLSICWMICVWLSVLPGFSEQCLMTISLEHIGWSATHCSINFGYLMFATLLKNQSLSCEMSRRRQKNTVRFFIQSLCQDWIYVLQIFICYYVVRWFEKDSLGSFMAEMGFDVLVPVVDGLIMLSFNFRNKKINPIIKTSGSNSTKACERPDPVV
ncbi:hypothetical protein GCK72_007016 [Caenorhabditis remanei]|uniref:7TM GPCR serpentine receptor class x (Srx) domain-containing protein n=1 Tax=Caenorhabditis remanei TaxID=31234 RepID=A0A6A5HGV9_CAERE|nr:hypothetical protein GCK72_007016 [Caenorhabditis remanei]KAF1767058.1 hypothetical protein GCK72_007016 [Caenorhabditis remanei]